MTGWQVLDFCLARLQEMTTFLSLYELPQKMVQELGQTSEFSGLIQDGIKLFQFRLLPEKDAL